MIYKQLPVVTKNILPIFDNFRIFASHIIIYMNGFRNIEIKNFRGIDNLKIDDFSRVNIFLGQGTADKKFFEDYYRHLFHKKVPEGSITLPIRGNNMKTLKPGLLVC